uniref:G protein-coupled receptor 179 n=1 Tax=Ictidomys tridecemlineatus TaxID=43179 RepID=I3MW63_ICTTR
MGTWAMMMPSLAWRLLGCCFLCSWALGDPRPLRSLPPLPSQAKPRTMPMWVASQGAEAALAFLYSGDAQQLLGANCSERYEALGAEARSGLPQVLQRAAGTLAQAANFLNMLLQANDIRESSVEEDVEWYQALVRSVVEGDPRAYRALLIFNPPPGASHLQLALQATRIGEETILQDLSGNMMQEESSTAEPDSLPLQKRVLTNDLRSLSSPKWPQGDGYVGDIQQVRLSSPFLECQEGQLRPGWLITLSATFYGLKPDLSPEVRGQVQMDIDLQGVDINQCASGPGWYSNTHLCDLNSTQCVPLENQGFVLGRYLCHCRPGFYGASGFGGLEESATQTTSQFGSPQGSLGRLLRCQPCSEGCTSCIDATPCLAEEAPALRAAVLAFQTCCMLAVFLSMLVSYHCRWSKRIRASGVVLLEIILFGSLLLYFPVFILYFKPSVFRCIALRWVRLLGFAIVYGTIILKLYRVLQLFLSRTAQRGPHLSSGHLLQRLGLLVLLVLGFLAMWTVGVLERSIQHTPLVTRGHTLTGRHFYLCHHDRWDYIMVVAEMLLLCWGSFLCYATRAVPSAFHEPRYMGIALHNELLLSAAFHMSRFVLVPSLHPDWTLLLFFFHTHSTVTATLALIFIPKFLKSGAPPREEILDEVYEDELDLQRSGSYLNSSIASAWSERSLDPGDIRKELKKLYAQLEVRKTKEMAANNPHLPKKRGSSRQGLGRSFVRYLAEFPEALTRQHSQDSGSLGHGSLPGSSRHRLCSSSLQEAEGPPALPKSCSTYDHQREQDPPLLDSLLRRNLSKKAPRVESRELMEGPSALGYRSASAHNLTVGERVPRTRPTSLQKSLSVVAGSREKALLVASQAYLEETYLQAKEREEQKKAEAAMMSPARRPSARRLEPARRAPLSAPPSPAKSSSVGSSHISGRLHEEAGRKLPHPPIRHQVSTPILALSGACLGEPRMLSPNSTLTPALMPPLAPTPTPALAPVPVSPKSPNVFTYICPWENEELPVKKENAAQEAPSEPERGSHSPTLATARLWRALSVAIEKRGAGEPEMNTEEGCLQGEADDVGGDRPKISKAHSLRTPGQQASMRSLGLAIKALTRSRSTYREKENGEESPERDKDKAPVEGAGASPQSPRLGQPKAVSKQAALVPCNDEESLQNQQNAHTSRMLQVRHQEGSREQEDRGRRTSQGLGEQKVERMGETGLAILRQVSKDKNAEQAKAAPVGRLELPKAGLHPLDGTDFTVAEVCPWEVTESPTCQLDSNNKVEICPWEVSEGAPKREAVMQELEDSHEERGKVPEKSESKRVTVFVRKKPERLVRGQEAVCPWESADPGGLSPQSVPQDSDKTRGRSEAVGSKDLGEAVDPEACSPDTAKEELCSQKESEREGEMAQEVMALPQERQKAPKKAAIWREQKLGGDLESFCPWESTDFRGPLAVSLQVPESLGNGIAEVCPWEAGDSPSNRKSEICPWELDDELPGKEAPSQEAGGESLQEKKKALGKGSSGEMGEQTVKAVPTVSPWQESVCPWEGIAPVQPSPCPAISSSKAGDQLLSNGNSRTMQLCPWEALKPEKKGTTPATAEICPWEVNETQDWTLGQAPKKGESQKDKGKMLEKAGIQEVTTREKLEAVCPWESMDPGSVQDTERPQTIFQRSGSVRSKAAEICPWDTEETLAPQSPGQREKTLEKERLTFPREEQEVICPWEEKDLKEPSAQTSKVSDLSSNTSSQVAEGYSLEVSDEATQKGDLRQDPRTDSLPEHMTHEKPQASKAEFITEGGRTSNQLSSICPWESVVPAGSFLQQDRHHPDQPTASSQSLLSAGSKVAEVCPWDAPDPDVYKPDSSSKAEICPWEDRKRESQEEGRTPEKLEPKMGARVAEVCPWEVEETPSAKKAEICPWEVGKKAAGEGELEQGVSREPQGQGEVFLAKAESGGTEGHFSKTAAKPGKEQLTVCPEKGTGSGEFFPQQDALDTNQPTVSPHGASSMGSKIAELCQWEVTDPEGNKIRGIMADICPWEETGALLEESGLLALTATQTENFPTAPEKSSCLLVHRPLERFLSESKSSHPKVSKPVSTLTLGGIREPQGPSGLGPKTCLGTESSLQEGEAQRSSSLMEDQGQVASEAQDEELTPLVYPWDLE